jgi:heterogeneous nuclear ribonucleoprotein A1/A3
VTSGSYSGHNGAGGFSGSPTGYGDNMPQYNGQDDLLGDDYFDSKEAAENR